MSKPGQRVRLDLRLIVSHYQMNAIVLLDIVYYACTVNATDPSIRFRYFGAEMKTGTTSCLFYRQYSQRPHAAAGGGSVPLQPKQETGSCI